LQAHGAILLRFLLVDASCAGFQLLLPYLHGQSWLLHWYRYFGSAMVTFTISSMPREVLPNVAEGGLSNVLDSANIRLKQ
jgi:hypothetical protein